MPAPLSRHDLAVFVEITAYGSRFVAGTVGWFASVRELVFIGHDLPDLFFGQEALVALHLCLWNSLRYPPEPVRI